MKEIREKKGFVFSTDAFYYFAILKKQWSLIFVFCLSAIFCSLLLTFVTSEYYQATTGVFYRPLESTVLRLKVTESFGSPVPNPTLKVINQTLYDIVKSDIILRPVVLDLELYKKDPPPRDSWLRYSYTVTKNWIKERGSDCISLLKYGRIIDEEPTAKAIRNLRSNISLGTKRDSYILTLAVKDTKPQRAAKIVDEIGKNLVSWLKLQDTLNFDRKLALLKEQLAAKELWLSDMRSRRARILSTNNLASLPEETGKSVSNQYEMELETTRIKSLIQEKQQRLAEMEADENQSKTYLNPDDMKRIKSQKLFESVELKGLIARLANIQGSLARTKSKLRRFPELQKKIEQLDMLVSAGTNEYQQLSDIYLEATQNSISARSEIRVISAASVPTSPVQPIKIYHVAITAILSLIISVSLVYILAFFNVRLFFASKGVQGRSNEYNDESIDEDDRNLSHVE